ncbi:MAG: aspartate aminotransferase family protein [Saprospiraceae bacterium]|nr:aspartate aminotransferase family protein [Saprospiraceae bacterium]
MLSQRQLFLNHVAQTSDMPMGIEIVDSKGIYLLGKGNKSYIDLISGISVSSLGHNHPKIVDAIQKQAGKYLHTLVYGEFVLSPQVELATLLAKHLPPSLDSTYFVNSGTEATEGALKLAKRYTGRSNIVACKNAYHGSTNGSLSLMSDSFFTAPFRPLLPNVKFIEFNNPEDLHMIDEHTACVVMEPVRAEVGIQKPENDYLKAVRQRCTETGTLLIFDEIQMGCGRTGSLFAFEQYDVVPDILLLAKAFGGGMPLGAFVSSKEIMQVFTNNPFLGHITTFGGHPVCCAAALASLQLLTEDTSIIPAVKKKEALFLKLLQHPKIKTIRSAGLIMAVEIGTFTEVKAVIDACIRLGLITDWFLFNDGALRVAPPLIITEDEIHKACSIILQAIKETLT